MNENEIGFIVHYLEPNTLTSTERASIKNCIQNLNNKDNSNTNEDIIDGYRVTEQHTVQFLKGHQVVAENSLKSIINGEI